MRSSIDSVNPLEGLRRDKYKFLAYCSMVEFLNSDRAHGDLYRVASELRDEARDTELGNAA